MKTTQPVETLQKSPRVFGFSLSFFTNSSLRRVLKTAGIAAQIGWPKPSDTILVWGRGATSKRGFRIARATNASVITAEDAFLRSVKTGRQGDAPIGVITDKTGIYFETEKPNDLALCLQKNEPLTNEETNQAREGIEFLRRNNLSKYNDFDLAPVPLPQNFVLVVDQTFADASIKGANANADTFEIMLQAALDENPNDTILVKTHPETQAGKRLGHFAQNTSSRVMFFSDAISPWFLFGQAKSVYCVSSQMGLEAILAGHRPVVFGNAFYAGLGLSDDRNAATLKRPPISREQLFHAVYVSYCQWHDPFFDRPSNFQTAAQNLSTKAQAARERRNSQVFVGMRLWKRGFLKRFFKGIPRPPKFVDTPAKALAQAKADQADVLVWSGKETPEMAETCEKEGLNLIRVEDGFLRSTGLGAQLIEPVSLAFDTAGIYYDPTRKSDLETLIAASVDLPEYEVERAKNVRQTMIAHRLSKYNLPNRQVLNVPSQKHLVLVPGQVEDDQSILKGAKDVATNLELVRAARQLFPDSHLIYKPHPDVVAALRQGGAESDAISELADAVVVDADITTLLDRVDHVATITSQTGFEALLRGKKVTCFGAPFYAGWGLTQDVGWVPERRCAKPTLDGLVHAALIGYPRYWDPVTGDPCPIEVVLERFARGEVVGDGRRSIRLLAKAQGLLASYAYLWR